MGITRFCVQVHLVRASSHGAIAYSHSVYFGNAVVPSCTAVLVLFACARSSVHYSKPKECEELAADRVLRYRFQIITVYVPLLSVVLAASAL